MRHRSLKDRLISELGHALASVRPASALGEMPEWVDDDVPLSPADVGASGRMMRINHIGEIQAQALYRGQALCSQPEVRDHLLEAADEEQQHLAWCRARCEELGATTSSLAALCYGGSFALGIAAALARNGGRSSLGFVAETEKQVERHLDTHLHELPEDDVRSRSILQRMRDDEVRHGAEATSQGGEDVPHAVQWGMGIASRLVFAAVKWV